MSKGHLIFGIVALIILIAVITNPDKTTHLEKIQPIVLADYKNFYKQTTGEDKELSLISIGYIYTAIQQSLSVRNFVLFSTTTLQQSDGKKTYGIGVFGNVFMTKDFKYFFEDIVSQRE